MTNSIYYFSEFRVWSEAVLIANSLETKGSSGSPTSSYW